jgi:hypothetical protein
MIGAGFAIPRHLQHALVIGIDLDADDAEEEVREMLSAIEEYNRCRAIRATMLQI